MPGTTGSRRGNGPAGKKGKSPGTRRSALSPDVQAKIIESLEAGSENREAAEAAGIAEGTFYGWLKRAREKGDEPYLSFERAVRQAEASAEDNAMKCIANAMPTDWRAAAWFKEQRAKTRAGGATQREKADDRAVVAMTREGMEDAARRLVQRSIGIAERSNDPSVVTAALGAVTRALEALKSTEQQDHTETPRFIVELTSPERPAPCQAPPPPLGDSSPPPDGPATP